MNADRPYVLGHTARELDRLDLQGAFYGDVTRRALRRAGVGPGMHVLDIGSGSGDLTLLAAELVGAGGSVTGLERDRRTADAARERARSRGASNVTFQVGVADAAAELGPFDALVGRFVLMHQEDPVRTLAGAARAVRPGGVVAMIESHMAGLLTAGHSLPHSVLYDRIIRWKCRVVEAAGADIEAGLRLRTTFLEAGLPGPVLHMESRVDGGADPLVYRYLAESARSMLPMAERLGVPGLTRDDVEILERQLRDEVLDRGGVLVSWPLVAAWVRKTG